MQAWRNGEAVFGEFYRRFKQLSPRQATVFLMGQLQGSQDTRRPHGTTANLRLGKSHRFPVRLQEQLLGGTGRRGFAAVVGAHGFAIPKHDQCATTNTRRLRFDQRQHGLHRNRRVDGRAASAQHLAPGFSGQRVGGGRHVFFGMLGAQVGAIARGAFWGDGQRRCRSVVTRSQG
ncbi:hypothetical protein D3C85_1184610 [compost metagenome]